MVVGHISTPWKLQKEKKTQECAAQFGLDIENIGENDI